MAANQDKARVVFLWHMHQPSYESPDGNPPAMPWVRLHACRAYRDLAWVLDDHPTVQMVVNFVPCLLDQLEHMAAGGTDAFRELTRRPPQELSAEERRFLAQHFFSCRAETLIDPVPRFAELFQRREAVLSWSAQDLLDLQLHFNLAWMGPAVRAEEPFVAALLRQGRNFNQSQKELLLQLQDRVCARIVPEWRRLAERGQIELTTTPYYHPILPLLIDTNTAERCQPGATLPPRFSWPEDARWQVSAAVARHRELFGEAPAGMWPAEGSVSPEAVGLIREEGLRWLATDEGILLRSLRPGAVREHVLYRPYRAPGNGPLMLFRDRDLSDRIGFTYAKEPAERAVDDLIGRLQAAGAASLERRDHPPGGPVITVALDGENPWEGYVDGGIEFLHRLCRRFEEHPLLTTLLPRDLDPAQVSELPRLHSGSWIDSSYRIWIGGQVENRAWTMLGQARQALSLAMAEGHPRAAEALAVLRPAEGSDWFWWFGDDFTTTQELLFDALFRARLRRAYELVGRPVPAELQAPVDQRRQETPTEGQGVARPVGLIRPTIDGRVTGYYEWAGAVEVPLGGGRAAMFQGARRLGKLFYGFSLDTLYLRIDLLPEAERGRHLPRQLRFRFGHDAQHELLVPLSNSTQASPPTWQGGPPQPVDGVSAATGKIVELGIPFATLGVGFGHELELDLVFEEEGLEVDRAPGQGTLRLRLPDEDVLSWSWMV